MAKGSARAEVEVEGRRLTLSNLGKIFYPETGFTKGDVIDYYARIAPVMVPHLEGRATTLVRFPDGVEGPHFYEKNSPSHRPEWVTVAPLWSRHNGGNINFTVVDSAATLVWMANLASIEVHPSLALVSDYKAPTSVVFDLDPGPPAGVVECCDVALQLREVFDQLKLECVVKTSGSKGLQAYVPLNSPVTYDQTKPFALALAQLLEKRNPGFVTSNMAKDIRPGKVFVDWSQNDEHKTTVAVYSMRAKTSRPTVSAPVSWAEIEACAESRDPESLVFLAGDVLERVAEQGDLFACMLDSEQELPRLS
ncbi:MAG: non-homologous end-joining DNA ligase [Acidimicrobiia bacterium]